MAQYEGYENKGTPVEQPPKMISSIPRRQVATKYEYDLRWMLKKLNAAAEERSLIEREAMVQELIDFIETKLKGIGAIL
jgi:hypothetical protein